MDIHNCEVEEGINVYLQRIQCFYATYLKNDFLQTLERVRNEF